jgi:hypothetical protein
LALTLPLAWFGCAEGPTSVEASGGTSTSTTSSGSSEVTTESSSDARDLGGSSTGTEYSCGDGIVSGDEHCDGQPIAGVECPAECRFEPGSSLWELVIDYDTRSEDVGWRSVACTSDSDLIVAGTAGHVPHGEDAYVAKVSAVGELVWGRTVRPSRTVSSDLRSLVAAPDGFFATGAASSYEAWFVKFDGDGEIEWQDLFVGTQSDTTFAGTGVVVRESGIGEFAAEVGIPASTVVGHIVRYAEDGTRRETLDVEVPPFIEDGAMSISSLSLMAVTPAPRGRVLLSGGLVTQEGRDAFLQLRDADYAPIWDATVDSPDEGDLDAAREAAVDEAGFVYLAMAYRPVDGYDDIRVVKYSPDGEEVWHVDHAGPYDRPDWPTGLAVDAQGNVFVHATLSDDDAPQALHDYDMWLARYTSDGELVWQHEWDGMGAGDGTYSWDYSGPIAMCPDGTLAVAGRTFSPSTEYDILVRKVAP